MAITIIHYYCDRHMIRDKVNAGIIGDTVTEQVRLIGDCEVDDISTNALAISTNVTAAWELVVEDNKIVVFDELSKLSTMVIKSSGNRFPICVMRVPIPNNEKVQTCGNGDANGVECVIEWESTAITTIMVTVDDTNDDTMLIGITRFDIESVGTVAMNVMTDGDGDT